MNSIAELKKQQRDYHYKLYPYVKEWKKNPYSWLKAEFYMQASALLVYLLLKTKIKPNTVSIAYGLSGLAGGILLAFATKVTVLIAISIFFLKGILDWSDGHLARIRGQTSVTGAILDPYGALLGALGLQMGLGFYVVQKSGMIIFYYLTALIPLFYAARLTSFSYRFLFYKQLKSEKLKEYRTKNVQDSKKYGRLYNLFKNFLDDRARTVDFICLLFILEIFTSIFITWIIFLGFFVKQFLFFFACFYIVSKGGWLEKKFEDKAKYL